MPSAVVGRQASDREGVVSVGGDAWQGLQLRDNRGQIQRHAFVALRVGREGGPVVAQVVAAPLNGIHSPCHGDVKGVPGHHVDAVVVTDGRLEDHGDAVVKLVIALCGFHDRGKGLDVPMPVHVVLPVFGQQILGAWLVGQHVVAFPVRGRFLEDVPHIKRREVWIGLKHQGHGSGGPWRGHARSTERNVTVASVVGHRHDVRADKGHVWLDAPLFCWPLAAVNRDAGVFVQGAYGNGVLRGAGRANLRGHGAVACGDEHGDASAHHLIRHAVDAVLFRGRPLDGAGATEAHGGGSNVVLVAVIDRPLHAGHNHGKAARATRIEDLHTYQEGARRHAGVLEGRGTGPRHGTGAV